MSEDEIPGTGGDDDERESRQDQGPSTRENLRKGRERLEQEADKAVDQFDEGIVDLLSWVLDTETRARIYVYLRKHTGSTSEEIAEGTGLYPSTVREALAELHDEGTVTREKRESAGAGNNPYEYTAIAPSDLVGGMLEEVQRELNTVFNLDSYLGETGDIEVGDSEPISITVEDADEGGDADDDDAGSDGVDVVSGEDDSDEE